MDKQELTSHFHGEDDDSNLGGMPRKCPSKACFLEMSPELLWKRGNREGGEKGSPRQRMASLKTDVCTTGAGGGGRDGKRGCAFEMPGGGAAPNLSFDWNDVWFHPQARKPPESLGKGGLEQVVQLVGRGFGETAGRGLQHGRDREKAGVRRLGELDG